MASAAVVTAGVALVMVMVVLAVVVTADIGIEFQLALHQRLGCRIRIAGYTAIELDTRCCQRSLGTAADAAADQHLCIQGSQNTGQSAVAAAAGIHNGGRHNFPVLHIVNLELFGVAEMLEDFTVCVSYRDSHNMISFQVRVFSIFIL